VSSRERDGVVEEEQLRVAAGSHDLLPAPVEFEPAADPEDRVRRPDDPLAVVVQHAPVAHECAAGRRRDQFAVRADAVPKRHAVTVVRGCDGPFG
jgi:hypothetical protein